jgi:hypothetical protein
MFAERIELRCAGSSGSRSLTPPRESLAKTCVRVFLVDGRLAGAPTLTIRSLEPLIAVNSTGRAGDRGGLQVRVSIRLAFPVEAAYNMKLRMVPISMIKASRNGDMR